MKTLLTSFFLVLVVFAYSQPVYEWEIYEKPLMISKTNANTINAFENTPESIVSYFYASKIRNDKKWQKVIPALENRSEKLKRNLIKYERWNISRFQLRSKTEFEKNKLWVKIFFEIEYDGQKDSGTDEVTLHLIDGVWIIVGVPT